MNIIGCRALGGKLKNDLGSCEELYVREASELMNIIGCRALGGEV